MSDTPKIHRRRFLHGLGALGVGGALSACVGPTITSRGAGGGSTATSDGATAASARPGIHRGCEKGEYGGQHDQRAATAKPVRSGLVCVGHVLFLRCAIKRLV